MIDQPESDHACGYRHRKEPKHANVPGSDRDERRRNADKAVESPANVVVPQCIHRHVSTVAVGHDIVESFRMSLEGCPELDAEAGASRQARGVRIPAGPREGRETHSSRQPLLQCLAKLRAFADPSRVTRPCAVDERDDEARIRRVRRKATSEKRATVFSAAPTVRHSIVMRPGSTSVEERVLGLSGARSGEKVPVPAGRLPDPRRAGCGRRRGRSRASTRESARGGPRPARAV